MTFLDLLAALLVVGCMVAGLAIVTRPAPMRPVSPWCLRRVNRSIDAQRREGQ